MVFDYFTDIQFLSEYSGYKKVIIGKKLIFKNKCVGK